MMTISHPDLGALLNREYLTEEELSTALGKSIHTLRRWHALREGPPRITHRNLALYRSDALRKWLAERESFISRKVGGGAR